MLLMFYPGRPDLLYVSDLGVVRGEPVHVAGHRLPARERLIPTLVRDETKVLPVERRVPPDGRRVTD